MIDNYLMQLKLNFMLNKNQVTMKKIFNLALTAVLAVGMVSCSEDTDNVINPENQTNGKLTFVLPYASGVTTYAGEVPASDAEKEIVLANTKVYMFKDDDTLEEILTPTAGSPVGGKGTATIDVDDAWTGGKTFIMVANTDAAATDLATVATGMDMDDFKDLLTDSKGNTQIACPLLMAGTEGVLDIQAESTITMDLFRSVARFDINNNVTNNKVTIKNVYVTNANLNGYIMGYERSSLEMNSSVEIAAGVAKGDLDEVTIPAAVAGVQTKEAAFYLHPTVVGKDATGTVITLEVEEDGGATAFYTVHKFDATGTTKEDIIVEANHRYIISSKINPVTGKLMFILAPADWDEGKDVIGVPGTGSAFGVIAPQAADVTNGTFNATYNSIAVTDPTAIFSANLAVKGTSTKGVTAEVLAQTSVGLIEVNGDIIKVTTPTTDGTITYAAPYFKYTFTVSFEADKIEADKNFTTIVRLTDVASGATTDVTLFYSENDTPVIGEDGEEVVMYNTGAGYLPAVKINNLYWAPVNVGAIKIAPAEKSVSTIGLYYQWGREYFGFYPDETLTTVAGPISKDLASSTYKNDLIVANEHWYTENQISDWPEKSQGPCPDGWYIPSGGQVQPIVSDISTYKTRILTRHKNAYSIKGDNGEDLYLPMGGRFDVKTMTSNDNTAIMAIICTSTNYTSDDGDTPQYRQQVGLFVENETRRTYMNRATAVPVRCVKNVK